MATSLGGCERSAKSRCQLYFVVFTRFAVTFVDLGFGIQLLHGAFVLDCDLVFSRFAAIAQIVACVQTKT